MHCNCGVGSEFELVTYKFVCNDCKNKEILSMVEDREVLLKQLASYKALQEINIQPMGLPNFKEDHNTRYIELEGRKGRLEELRKDFLTEDSSKLSELFDKIEEKQEIIDLLRTNMASLKKTSKSLSSLTMFSINTDAEIGAINGLRLGKGSKVSYFRSVD